MYPYNDFNHWLRRRFGGRVQKITVDAGFSCPNRDGTLATGGCLYCNARGSGTGAHARGLSITEQLEQGKKILARRYKANRFLAYFQSFTNTYAPLAALRDAYAEALAVSDVVGLSIGTRPDCVTAATLDLLEEHARRRMVWIEYGLQSAHDATLRRIRRGHDFEAFVNAVERTRGRGIHLCAHVILGLPGETRAEMLATADAVAGLEIDGIKIHLLYVVAGTGLHALYAQGGYRCLKQEEYVELVCDVLERLPAEMVIQRLTGDPHRSELVAPQWALDKSTVLERIRRELARRGTRQGSRFAPARPV